MPSGLTPTSFALLGQLALRPWSVYEMTHNVGRTLHWFWPRAESVLYQETKRLADLGLATATQGPGRRGRLRSEYAITPAGRAALRAWLGRPPARATLHSEALLRVHLAPYGTVADLVAALESARADAETLLRQAVTIGTEFAEGRHQFQDQVPVRAILFDALWTFGLGTYLWAERSLDAVSSWPSLAPGDPASAEAVALIRARLADLPESLRADWVRGQPATR
jgi:DNA-binding PadR family transcriptional regulator